MTRLGARLDEVREAGRAGLIIYITEGDPSPERTAEIVLAAARAGADVVELGIPFSDPNADGPVIQAAMQRALAAGGGLESALATTRAVREAGCEVPIVLFGYYNPIFVCGPERFAARAAAAGADAALVVDLPLEELSEIAAPLSREGLGVVPLVAPTTSIERAARAAELDPPFVYYISTTGVTGARFQGAAGGADRVRAVRRETGAPVAVGFGVKTGADAREVAGYADAVVVGSAVVARAAGAAAGREAEAVEAIVAELRGAVGARGGR